jgi:hypothetical protein
MAWYDIFKNTDERIDERIKAFKDKDEEAKMTLSDWKNKSGENKND